MMKRYYHVSFDDVYSCLRDLGQHDYRSAFENPFLGRLRDFRRKYRAVFTLNTFNRCSADPDYRIEEVTDRYQAEFAQNTDWLRFSFHAASDLSNYGAGLPGTMRAGVLTGDIPDEIGRDYQTFLQGIRRLTGTDHAVDRTCRLGFFSGTRSNTAALMYQKMGLQSLLAADDSRISYYLTEKANQELQRRGFYWDPDLQLLHVRTLKRLEQVTDPREELAKMLQQHFPVFEIFTHERVYTEAVDRVLETYLARLQQENAAAVFPEHYRAELGTDFFRAALSG